MLRTSSLAVLLLVAACGQQQADRQEPGNAVPEKAAEAAKPAVPALDGSWKLTKLDGKPVDGMAMTFGSGRASIAAGCNRRVWSFTQDRNIVSFAADPGGSANCASSPSVDDEAAFHAIDRATMAIFAEEGREANLSGNGGNVTLERS